METLMNIINKDDIKEFESYVSNEKRIENMKKRPVYSWSTVAEIPLNVILINVPTTTNNYYYFIKRLIDLGAFFEIKEPFASVEGYQLVKDVFKTNFVYKIANEFICKAKEDCLKKKWIYKASAEFCII